MLIVKRQHGFNNRTNYIILWRSNSDVYTTWYKGELQSESVINVADLVDFNEEDIMSWVAQTGTLDMDKFNTCYNDPAQKAEVDADLAAGAQAGISGTPSFVINGKLIVGAQPYSVLKAEIESALAE